MIELEAGAVMSCGGWTWSSVLRSCLRSMFASLCGRGNENVRAGTRVGGWRVQGERRDEVHVVCVRARCECRARLSGIESVYCLSRGG